MKFTRKRVLRHEPHPTSVDANGNPTTTPVEDFKEVSDLILGDGSSVFSIPQKNGTFSDVETVLVTQSAFTDEATFEILLNGNRQVFVHMIVEAFGANITGIKTLIEFEDPDRVDVWMPSKEGVNREADITLHEWHIADTGMHILASRVEHRQFTKARVRFKAEGGAADADTKVLCTWHHDGGISRLGSLGNDAGKI